MFNILFVRIYVELVANTTLVDLSRFHDFACDDDVVDDEHDDPDSPSQHFCHPF